MSDTTGRLLLHYETHLLDKDADWVVFIHGAGGSIVTWKYQVNAFKPFFNLLLIDLRDHGKSKNIEPAYENYNFDIVTQDVLKVIDHLGIRRAHFLSVSLGSVVLQKLDEIRPELVDKMVMAGGVFRATFTIKLFVHSAKFLNYFLPYRAIYNLFSWVVLPRKNHAQSRRIFRMQSQKLSPKEYLKWVGLYKDFFRLLRRFFNRELENLSLVVMGDQDHVFFQAAKRFASTHKQAQLVILEKCGHVCNIEQYERFNQTALSFLLGKPVETLPSAR
ncbi:alpha/beta fold hydrolase [Phaeodactylibacter luteus]|uniref:Alpha/beta hydrolase n=1 Tax=Phaeodactylibacter luteus TaxID=1564516 RepID=A0A5C6RQ15_9BACT|nr:alpha/beta hydrolase [Phaeodactylibacter luteus]TXB63472.1 alpha/beta hydrolase [Phaeodactylibacter luteus]